MKASRVLMSSCAVLAFMAGSEVLAASKAAAKISPRNAAPMVRQFKAPAGTTLINQPPNGVNGYFADPDCQFCGGGQQSMADNFIVNAPGGSFQLTQIVAWGGYFAGNTPNATDDFDILIHNSAGTIPGSTIVFSLSNLQPTTRVATGVVLFGVDEYIFTFDLAAPPTLPNGTYWIEMFNNTAPTPGVDYFWETTNVDPTSGISQAAFAFETPGQGWNPNPDDQSMVLSGNPVPVELQEFSVE